MNVIVFGGSGFVGSHVAGALTQAGHRVRIYDRERSPHAGPGQEMRVGDILDAEAVREAVAGQDVVYNFAGLANLDDATTKPLDTVMLNIAGNAHILEAARMARCSRYVYASTIYVHSELGGFYRCSKQAAETYVEEYQRRYQLPFTILRYGTLYGPRADARNSVFRYLQQARTLRRIRCSGTGEEMREYLHVRDAATLSVDILAETYRNRHIIITGHHPMKFRDLLAMINEMLGGGVAIEYEAERNPAHYTLTPYTFAPKIGQKLTTNCYTDIGQGLLECLHDGVDEPEDVSAAGSRGGAMGGDGAT